MGQGNVFYILFENSYLILQRAEVLNHKEHENGEQAYLPRFYFF